jgi:hypothetical protein
MRSHAHREAALGLPDDDFRNQRLPALDSSVRLGDAHTTGRALDLDAN